MTTDSAVCYPLTNFNENYTSNRLQKCIKGCACYRRRHAAQSPLKLLPTPLIYSSYSPRSALEDYWPVIGSG